MSIRIVGDECCGCRACLQKCNLNAITMVNDAYGFEYPRVDSDKCVECGLCESTCPILHIKKNPPEVYACGMAYALDGETKEQGSSGGMFGVLARAVIAQGGIVYGAALDRELKLKTTGAETVDQLLPLYKSKYLLCDTNGKFCEIEAQLKKGRAVMYCSSPCQISALKSYLKADYENLITVDFVCHGVGSQSLFDGSVAYFERKNKIKIDNMVFRCKRSDASSHQYTYTYSKNGRTVTDWDLYFSFPYYNAYCKQLVYRNECYQCKYATHERTGDITVGDFHTVKKYDSTVDRFAGVSMILVNTEKGKRIFDSVEKDIFFKPMDKEVLYVNNRFSTGEKKPAEYDAFMECFKNEGFDKTVKRYLLPRRDWMKIIYYKSPRFIRNMAVKLLMR